MNEVAAFLLAGAAVVGAGVVLTTSADAVAERSRLGRVWVGAVLLAAATSLPELATDVAAVRLGAPDLAVGDLFGSSMANMLILALLDLALPRRALLRSVALDHALAASLAITTNAIAAAFVLAAPASTFLGVSPGSVALAVLYLAGMRAIRRATAAPGEPDGGRERARGLAGPIAGFALAAVVILAAAPLFARSAEAIAVRSGLGATFVGTLLLGLSTSLPELVSCLTAVRIGALDLAVGNLFGSNAFNMAILLALDLAAPGRSIFAIVAPTHAISALFAVALMALALAAIVYRAERRFRMIEPDSVAMLVLYAVGVALLYAETVPR
jgi:cation:H+ antiporter